MPDLRPAVTCPQCGHNGPPEITKEVSTMGWVMFVVLLCFCLLLCWLPFVIDAFKENKKKCAGCGFKF